MTHHVIFVGLNNSTVLGAFNLTDSELANLRVAIKDACALTEFYEVQPNTFVNLAACSSVLMQDGPLPVKAVA